MFDFHMHSTVSFDGKDPAQAMVEAAAAAGANVIVAGTSVFKHKNGIPCAIAELHQAQQVLNG